MVYATALACAPLIELIRTQFLRPVVKGRIDRSQAYSYIRISLRTGDQTLCDIQAQLAVQLFDRRSQSGRDPVHACRNGESEQRTSLLLSEVSAGDTSEAEGHQR